ncbi:sugar phosphate isomerase/epimerase family protein [Haloferula sp.]|uniref:sugar phosphate isomerase/epimerase family protein n=1 Tax=Haloferula sp. TaxID=2497595 RepID=UPI003C70FFB1
MELKLYKTLWGHDGGLPEAIELAAAAGFSGIEGPAPLDKTERAQFFADLDDGGMEWISEVSTCTAEGKFVPMPGYSAEAHLASLEEGVRRSLEGRPLFVNTMGGYDAWSHDEAMRFHEGVIHLEEKHGIDISVETHRGRSTYSPWLTRDLLLRLPELKITCDFSHWCVVSERLILDEEPEILALAAAHAYHIQPRVGYDQGPQVPDPRAPEHEPNLLAHERWWDVVWASMRERGRKVFTMTPEFGPDGYLQCAPFSGEPVANLWELNRWIGLRQKERFQSIELQHPTISTP